MNSFIKINLAVTISFTALNNSYMKIKKLQRNISNFLQFLLSE